MMTLKFDYVDVTDEDHGCIKLLEGYDIWYQRKKVETHGEFAEYVKRIEGFRSVGSSVLTALDKSDGEPVYFTHIQFFNHEDHLQNVMFHGGMCYIMNEEGKTVDIIH